MAHDGGDGNPFTVHGYESVSQVGRGASSNVYKGYDPELSRWVAIKVLLTDDAEDPARKRFKREGEITANLGKHPHIVQVLGTGFTDNGNPFVVMEYFEQGSIGDRLRTSGTFSVDETLDIGEKIADAVAAAHRAGILHRDIKPQNILLSEYGPALGDFGIARSAANPEWSQSLDQLTPMHAAPEILLGGASTPQSDIYSLGSALYTMLSGRAPFAGAPGEAPLRYQVRVMQDPVPPIPRTDVPPSVTAILVRSLAKDPGDRYRSAVELRDDLRTSRRQTLGAGSPTTPPTISFLVVPPETAGVPAPDDQSTVVRPARDTTAADSQVAATAPTISAEEAAESPASGGTEIPPRTAGVGTDPGSAASDGSDDEVTVMRRPPVGGSEEPDASVNGRRSRRRTVVLTAVGAVVVAVATMGALALFGKQAPVDLHVNKVVKTTFVDTDETAPVKLAKAGSGALLTWSDQGVTKDGFLISEYTPVHSPPTTKLISATPGTTSLSLPDVDPSTTHFCYFVNAIVNTHTFSRRGYWCPPGESAPQS